MTLTEIDLQFEMSLGDFIMESQWRRTKSAPEALQNVHAALFNHMSCHQGADLCGGWIRGGVINLHARQFKNRPHRPYSRFHSPKVSQCMWIGTRLLLCIIQKACCAAGPAGG